MNPLITPQEADDFITESLNPLPTEEVELSEALGRTLRQSLVADRDFPPFDRVTMDGIACRDIDLAMGPLTIQGLQPAGAPTPAALKPGHCWQITTGAVMPSDCDTIIPVEELSLSESHVTVASGFQNSPGQFIHRKGSDCKAGHELLTSGTILNPSHLGLAATIGATRLQVSRLPRIAILTTGDELVPADQTPLPHQLRRSNGIVLQSALRQTGPTHPDNVIIHLADDFDETLTALRKVVSHADLVLLSGGISKGKKDFIRPALESLIGEPTFHGIAQRPGKPLAYWKPSNSNPPLFALPGNPNSTFTTFLRYVRPALHHLAGTTNPKATTLPFAQPEQAHPKLTIFLPAHLQTDGTVAITKPQNSGDFASTLSATGFVEIPPGTSLVESGLYFA